MLAPASIVQQFDKNKSVVREPVMLEVTVRDKEVAKFATPDEKKTNFKEHVDRRGPRHLEKATEAKKATI